MFGIWRTLLAIEVVAHHLLNLPVIGFYAVFSFFVLSGFLMTAIMHETYGYSLAGLGRYLSNRALRLFPNYWFAVAVSLVLIAVLGAGWVTRYNAAMAMPETPFDWLQNLSMIFANWLPKNELPRLVPLAWALTVEIFYYVMIGLGASRTRLTTILWLLSSLIYVVVIRQVYPGGGGYLYDAIPAGSLPFSVGALAWHYRQTVVGILGHLRLADARLLISGRWLLYLGIITLEAQTGWKWLLIFGNWLNVLVSAAIICTLFTTRSAGPMHRIDKAVGDFSYPIYLLHLQMGLLATVMLSNDREATGPGVFALGLGLTVVLSALCAWVIDPAVEQQRRRIKCKAKGVAGS